MTAQPKWKLVAQMGDVNPMDYGGFFVYVDETGVYAPEAESLELNEGGKYTAHRFTLEPCTYIDGVLSDNPYHPKSAAWFADDIEKIQACTGIDGLVALFCSQDPIERATAWRAVAEYSGLENLDSYPLTLTKKECKKRYGINS